MGKWLYRVRVSLKGIVLIAAGMGAVILIVLLVLRVRGRKAGEWETAPTAA